MNSCSLTEGDSSLALSFDADGSGDVLVSIEVRSDGFEGHADGHVAGAEWREFVASLERLEKDRKGAARFESAFPGEFEVQIGAINGRGHLGASGTLRYRRSGVEDWPQQLLQFAFQFDPTKLTAFVHAIAARRLE